jgi:biotin-dependent carboxylase-like uncharacterized protein
MIRFLTSGIHTTIQDNGRFGYRKFGVPTAGPMDLLSAVRANSLVGNPPEAPLFEILLKGPIIRFEKEYTIAFCGNFNLSVNGKKTHSEHAIQIKTGDELTIGNSSELMYGYLAIKGELEVEKVLGSYSHYKGITQEYKIQKGTSISIHPLESHKKKNAIIHQPNVNKNFFNVQKGPEFNTLNPHQQKLLFTTDYKLSGNCNRMGYRFTSAAELTGKDIITSPVQPGTIQLTSSGQLIALMKDAQTTGGYSRILHMNENERSHFAQLRPYSEFKFNLSE